MATQDYAARITLPHAENLTALRQPVTIHGRTLPNRLCIQPMEGCDGTADGAPDELTIRRYHRFATSGAAVIWFEAVAVCPEGRANPRQLWIHKKNVDQYKRLLDDIRRISMEQFGFAPYIVVQLTHSGRYAKPEGKPAPLIMYNNPVFEKDKPLPSSCIVSDDYLQSLEDRFVEAEKLCHAAGFDAVDVKACHRYLLCESLSAYTRPGVYGGAYENRTRLFKNMLSALSDTAKCPLTTRMNLYDGFPLPYGWGVDENENPDMTEPIRLVTELRDTFGMTLFNFTVGNPYVNPHVNRPFNAGPYTPPEPPQVGLKRVCDCVRAVKQAVSDITVITSALSYPRTEAAGLAAGMIAEGAADLAGFGRMAFAYPTFAADILQKGALDPAQCCLACGKCSELMRANSKAGCVIRDSAVYLPLYRRDVQQVADDGR